MHYKTVKGILSAKNGMNLYRGCTHGCIYCDSRSICYQMEHDFEDIEVKENAIELLEQKLISKRKKCMISTGAMTDPYIHLESKLKLTKQALELIYKYGYGVALQTKSARVLRDLELLKKINERTKAVVEMTLTTYDDDLCKILEPNVSVTSERVDVLMKLKDANIPTVVWLSPFLPGINDTLDNIKGLMNYCIEANVKGVLFFGVGLTLREGNREYFYKQLDTHFPGLKQTYINTYGSQYEVLSKHHKEVRKYIHNVCQEYGIMSNLDEVFEYLHTFPKNEQLQLF